MPKFPHNTKFYCKKSIFALSLFLLFSFLPVPKANATVWPGIDPIIKTGLDQIRSMINNLIVGVMKQAAVSMLNTQINSLVSQETNGQSAFITDWEDYLIDRPLHNTAVHMNDYISEMTRGRNSYSGYSGEGFAGNYSADLGSYSRDMLEGGNDTPQVTYEGEPSKMFQNGSLKDMESYFSFSAPNNSWLFDIAVEKENQKYSQKETLKAQTKSVAYQGFNGTSAGDGDQISWPPAP